MKKVYLPIYHSEKKTEVDSICFDTLEGVEEYLAQSGFSTFLRSNNVKYYLGETRAMLIMENKEELESMANSYGKGDNWIKYAIEESAYRTNYYLVKVLKLEETDKEDTTEKISKATKDAVETWNNSDVKKKASSFLSQLGKKTERFLNDLDEEKSVTEIKKMRTDEFVKEVKEKFDAEETPTDISISKLGNILATVSKVEKGSYSVRGGMNDLPQIEKEELKNLIDIYTNTDIEDREKTLAKKFYVESDYLKEDYSNEFSSKELALVYRDKVVDSLKIEEKEIWI